MPNKTITLKGYQAYNLDGLMAGRGSPMRGSPDVSAKLREALPEIAQNAMTPALNASNVSVEVTPGELAQIKDTVVRLSLAGNLTASQLSSYGEIIEACDLTDDVGAAIEEARASLAATKTGLGLK